jgi:hypothetical protein
MRGPGFPAAILRTQRALWKQQSRTRDLSALQLRYALLLDGPFDADCLERALQDLVARHEPLRTSFHGQPHHLHAEVMDEAAFTLERSGCDRSETSLSGGDLRSAVARFFEQRIDAGAALRSGCIQLEPDKHLLLLNFDHTAVDGWSLEILCREAELLYAAHLARCRPNLPPLPDDQLREIDLTEAAWRASEDFQRERRERQRNFSGLTPAAILPFGQPLRGLQKLRRRVLPLSPELLSSLRQTAARTSCTLFSIILTATACALCQTMRLPEIVLGTLVVNRATPLAQRVLGAHYGGTALRIRAAPAGSAADVLVQVRETLLAAVGHRLDVDALADLLAESAGAAQPLAPTCHVVMDRFPLHRLRLEDLTVIPVDSVRSVTTGVTALHDVSIPACAPADFVIFMRQLGAGGALSAFWDPERVHLAETLIASVMRHLQSLAGLPETPPNRVEPAAGTTVTFPDCSPSCPVVDVLSPWPLLRQDLQETVSCQG